MKALVVVLVVAALAAGAFALYAWRDRDDERRRAEAAAKEYAAWNTRIASASAGPSSTCEARQVEPLLDETWRVHLACGESTRCFAIDLEQYRLTRDGLYVSGQVDGVTRVACSADLWTRDQAAEHLAQSAWARERRARFISCTVPGEDRYAAEATLYAKSFGCRYDSPRGEGYVEFRTTGADTFEIEPSR
jgi:hypothetical protein